MRRTGCADGGANVAVLHLRIRCPAMSSSKPPAAPLRRSNRPAGQSASPVSWVRDLLQRPIKLERRGVELHVVLGEKPPPKAASSTGSGEALRRGHEQLRALLHRHPEARHLMRHLGFIEQTLARTGSRALKLDVPVPVLRKGLQQLDLLIRDEPSDALTYLRSRIEASIRARERVDRDDEPSRPDGVQVTEASQSLFDEMERSWTGHVPLSEDKPADRGA